MYSIQDKIRSRLSDLNMKQFQLVEAAKISKSAFMSFMTGRTEAPNAFTLNKIAKALGVTCDWLLDSSSLELGERQERPNQRQAAILAIFAAAERIGWEEVAKRVEGWDEDEGIIPAEPIAKPKGRQRIIPAIPIEDPRKGK